MKKIIHCLKTLLEISNIGHQQSDVSHTLKNNIVSCREEAKHHVEVLSFIKNIAPYLLEDPSDDSKSEVLVFVLWNSALLLCLRECLTHEEDCLSIGEQETVRKSLQFIIRLGVYPSLLPGVGIPLHHRTEFHNWNFSENLDYDKSHKRLIFSLVILLALIEQSTIKPIVLCHHLVDVLAICIQIGYGPIKKFSNTFAEKEQQNKVSKLLSHSTVEDCSQLFQYVREGSNTHSFVPDDLLCEMWSDRFALLPKFEQLQRSLYQPLLVRDLLILQNCVIKRQRSSWPKWYSRTCGDLLSCALLRSNGVKHIIDGILLNTYDFCEQNDITNSRKSHYEMIGQLIANPPKQMPNIEEYYESIGPQIFEMLTLAEDQKPPLVVACHVLINMLRKDASLVHRFVTCPIHEPLSNLCALKQKLSEESIEDALTNCVNILFKVFSINLDIGADLLPCLLQPVFFPLVALFTEVNGGVSHLQKPLEFLLSYFLNHSEDSTNMLNAVAFQTDDQFPEMFPIPSGVSFEIGENGGLRVLNEYRQKDVLSEIEQLGSSLLRLVSSCTSENLSSDWFLSLLERLSDTIYEKDNVSNDLSESEFKDKMLLLLLIQRLADGDCSALLKDTTKVISFVTGMLERSAELISTCEENFIQESLYLCLTILMLVISEKKELSSGSWQKLNVCLKPLKKLSTEIRDPVVKNLSLDLSIAIVTKGVADNFLEDTPNSVNVDEQKTQTNREQSEFEQALEELKDPSPATKGHALIVIKRLLLQKDPQTIVQKENLFSKLEEHLLHEDSYVYLTAIEALSSLSLIYTDQLFPRMVLKFTCANQIEQPIDAILKLGEVIVKVSKNLGDMMPKYRDILLNAFLTGAKNADDEIRLSSLSNLAEVCRLLKFSFGPNIQEVLLCLFSVSMHDPKIEIRRSGIMTLALMLRGLRKDALVVLQNEMLMIYRFLKKLYATESDDILKLHCQLALEEISEIMKDVSTCPMNLQKEIKIL